MESVRCFRCRAREISVFGDINAIILDSDQHAIDQISQGIYVFICQGAWIWPQDIGNKISLLKIETNMNMESFDQEPFLFCSGNWSKYLVRLVDGKVWEARDGKAFFPYSLHIDLQLGQKVVAITAGWHFNHSFSFIFFYFLSLPLLEFYIALYTIENHNMKQ